MIIDAIKYYYKATKLKDSLRQGAVQWKVTKPRLESVAEHTFGCLILATAIYDELEDKIKQTINLDRVLSMLAIHELEEVTIGDITPLSKTKKENVKLDAEKGVNNMVKNIKSKNRILSLTEEYNQNKTLNSKFAKAIDKLECVLEFKKYQDNGYVSLNNVTEEMLNNKIFKKLVDDGIYDLADIFFIYHQKAYLPFGIDEEFWFKKLKPLKIK